ncbi:hypothetical protein, partial [Nonomuraea zeae]
MFKRRLAVLGAAAVLAVTGLAGSAMADETPSPTAGAKVTCVTSDGKTIELAEALPAEALPGKAVAGKAKGGVVVSPDGKVTRFGPDEGPLKTEALPEGKVPEEAQSAPIQEGAVEALPALP